MKYTTAFIYLGKGSYWWAVWDFLVYDQLALSRGSSFTVQLCDRINHLPLGQEAAEKNKEAARLPLRIPFQWVKSASLGGFFWRFCHPRIALSQAFSTWALGIQYSKPCVSELKWSPAAVISHCWCYSIIADANYAIIIHTSSKRKPRLKEANSEPRNYGMAESGLHVFHGPVSKAVPVPRKKVSFKSQLVY